METIGDYYRQIIQRVKRQIDSKSDEYLLGVEIDQLVQYYADKFQLPLIERDNSREITYEKKKPVLRHITSMPFPVGRDIPVKVLYPIIPKAELEEVTRRQSSRYYPGYRMVFNEDSLIVTVYISGENVNQANKFARAIKELETVINWKNNDAKNGNTGLKTQLANYIRQKRKQLESDNKLLEAIIKKVPVRLVKRAKSTPTINLSVRKVIQPVYPKATKPEEPFLETEKVEAVLELLKNSGLSFETTPRVFSTMEEEQLRDVILSHLNSVFEGKATGETFVKKGKTDIHLRIKKGSILSMECGYWDGKNKYFSKIDQIFGYLTWRQNYGTIITFSRNKGFSNVIKRAKEAAMTHSSIIEGSLKNVGKSHFITTNKFPEDSMKSVTLHHILFNLYSE